MTLKQKLKLRKLSKNKAIVLYGIFLKKELDTTPDIDTTDATPAQLMQHYDIVTVAPSYQDACKVLDKLVYFNHFDHFSLWCQSHGYTDTCAATFPSWEKYRCQVIGQDTYNEEIHKYSVFTLTYTCDDLASILRIFSNCRPLLLPYEMPIELQSYLSHNSDPTTNTTSIPMYLIKLLDSDVVDGLKIKALLAQFIKK